MEFIPLDTEILLQVQLPTGRTTEVQACVKWVQKYPHMDRYQAGLEFIEPHEARLFIKQYMKWSK